MRAKRMDANTSQIAEAFWTLGWYFLDIHNLGHGYPDGLAVRRCSTPGALKWETLWVEIKSAKGKLTPDEALFHAAYPGLVHICRRAEDVFELCGAR